MKLQHPDEFWNNLPIPESSLTEDQILSNSRKRGRGRYYVTYKNLAAGALLLLMNSFVIWKYIHAQKINQRHQTITENLWINP